VVPSSGNTSVTGGRIEVGAAGVAGSPEPTHAAFLVGQPGVTIASAATLGPCSARPSSSQAVDFCMSFAVVRGRRPLRFSAPLSPRAIAPECDLEEQRWRGRKQEATIRPAALMLADPCGCPIPRPPNRSEITISGFAPMVLRLSRGDKAAARPSKAAWTVAAADRVRVRCQSPAVA
jgi:hypothetical protein